MSPVVATVISGMLRDHPGASEEEISELVADRLLIDDDFRKAFVEWIVRDATVN